MPLSTTGRSQAQAIQSETGDVVEIVSTSAPTGYTVTFTAADEVVVTGPPDTDPGVDVVFTPAVGNPFTKTILVHPSTVELGGLGAALVMRYELTVGAPANDIPLALQAGVGTGGSSLHADGSIQLSAGLFCMTGYSTSDGSAFPSSVHIANVVNDTELISDLNNFSLYPAIMRAGATTRINVRGYGAGLVTAGYVAITKISA